MSLEVMNWSHMYGSKYPVQWHGKVPVNELEPYVWLEVSSSMAWQSACTDSPTSCDITRDVQTINDVIPCKCGVCIIPSVTMTTL